MDLMKARLEVVSNRIEKLKQYGPNFPSEEMGHMVESFEEKGFLQRYIYACFCLIGLAFICFLACGAILCDFHSHPSSL